MLPLARTPAARRRPGRPQRLGPDGRRGGRGDHRRGRRRRHRDRRPCPVRRLAPPLLRRRHRGGASTYDAYVAAKATAGTSDDAAALNAWNAAKQEKLDAAAEIVASQLNMAKTVDAVTASVKAHHYVKAPLVDASRQGRSASWPPRRRARSRSAGPRSSGAAAYRIYRDGFEIVRGADPSYVDTDVTNGTTYSYTVMATNVAGWGAVSAAVLGTPDVGIPSAPTGLAAAAGDARVTLTWTAPAGVTGYRVYRDGSLVASPATATYVDTGVTNGTTYAYTVVA